MNGKIPMVKVRIKLISSGTRASSLSCRETSMERNINNALTSSAYPTFLLIALTFILLVYRVPQGGETFSQLLVVRYQFRYAGIEVLQLVVTVKIV